MGTLIKALAATPRMILRADILLQESQLSHNLSDQNLKPGRKQSLVLALLEEFPIFTMSADVVFSCQPLPLPIH